MTLGGKITFVQSCLSLMPLYFICLKPRLWWPPELRVCREILSSQGLGMGREITLWIGIRCISLRGKEG